MQQGTPSALNGNGRCHLTYFAGRGLAQPLRYMLAACGISWEETHLKEPSQIAALRAAGRLQFGQVPLLELHGKDHVQSGACLRYVDRAFGSGAKRTDAEQYDVDAWADGAVDFYRVFTPLPFSGDASARAAYIENKIHAQAVPRYIPTFEAQLAHTGGWLAGTPTPSHADAALYAAVEFAVEVDVEITPQTLPALSRWKSSFEALPGVAAYIGSKYHWGHPDEDYVSQVRSALA